MGGGGHVPIKSSPGTYAGVADAPPVSGPGPAPVPPPDHAPAGIAGALSAFSSNADVPGDVQSSTLEDLDRRMRALEAARKFPAQDADAAGQMQGVGAQAGGQQATQMIQQMVSSITGAIGGAVGGLMKPLEEIPQQAMQAMQPLMSALQQGHGAAGLASDEQLVDSLGGESGLGGARRRWCWRGPRLRRWRHGPGRLSGSAACADVLSADDSGSRKVRVDATGRWYATWTGADGYDWHADDATGRDGRRRCRGEQGQARREAGDGPRGAQRPAGQGPHDPPADCSCHEVPTTDCDHAERRRRIMPSANSAASPDAARNTVTPLRQHDDGELRGVEPQQAVVVRPDATSATSWWRRPSRYWCGRRRPRTRRSKPAAPRDEQCDGGQRHLGSRPRGKPS